MSYPEIHTARLSLLSPGKICYLLVVLVSLTFPRATKAQAVPEVQFEVSMDSAEYLIGDYITLTLEAKAPSTGEISWPEVADTLLGLELIERGEISEDIQKDERTLTQQLKFIYFDSGSFVIPPLAFEYATDSSETARSRQVESAAIPFKVVYAQTDSTGAPRPIKDRVDVAYRPVNQFLVFGLLAAALLGVLIFLLARRGKTATTALPQEKPKPTLPPYEHAMKRLAQLEERGLWQQDRHKLYHIELTDILREYIEGRFGYNTLEQTTPEILDNFKGKKELRAGGYEHKENLGLLEKILQQADMVKFAKARLLPDEHQQSMRWTRELIERTRPLATAPSTTAE